VLCILRLAYVLAKLAGHTLDVVHLLNPYDVGTIGNSMPCPTENFKRQVLTIENTMDVRVPKACPFVDRDLHRINAGVDVAFPKGGPPELREPVAEFCQLAA
jgi:hypothetical protein